MISPIKQIKLLSKKLSVDLAVVNWEFYICNVRVGQYWDIKYITLSLSSKSILFFF